jgi:hypothetical protein
MGTWNIPAIAETKKSRSKRGTRGEESFHDG